MLDLASLDELAHSFDRLFEGNCWALLAGIIDSGSKARYISVGPMDLIDIDVLRLKAEERCVTGLMEWIQPEVASVRSINKILVLIMG